MAVTIHVNGASNSLAHKGSMGIAKSTLPDVCKTPSPGGPVPIPYPVIISMSSDLKKGSKKVKFDGGNSAAIKGSEYSRCSGDEPGTAGGVKSSTNMKEATWILYSFDVKIEGKNACRLSDKMMMNHGNTACLAGEIQPPVIAPPPDPCAEALAAALEEAEPLRDVTPKRDRPRAASGLRASNGQTVGGHSGGGNNAAVERLARSFPDTDGNGCGCAELNCISNAMDQGINVSGAVISTVQVRGRNSPTSLHGTPMRACAVCAEVLSALNITDCAGGG